MTYAIPKPIASSGETNTAGANWQGENLANDDPSTRSPSRCEEEDVYANECDHGSDCGWIVAVHCTHNCDQELADQHTQGTPDEQRSTTESFNGPEGDRGRAHVDESGDQTDQERVVDGAKLIEEGGAKIEDEIDTGPLLHHLHRSTQNRAAEVGTRFPETSFEAIGPAAPVAALGNHLQFVFVVGDNLGKFVLNEVR